jgi:aromatic-L-amino-acid decarboxylase
VSSHNSSLSLGADRDKVLQHAAEIVSRTWAEFDDARDHHPEPSAALLAVLTEPMPEVPSDPIESLDLAAEALDSSLTQARPRYLAYIGSSGLEIGALGDLLAHSHDPNLAIYAGAASDIETQAIRWLAQFLGYSSDFGFFTSGGTISNLTALAAARERALPRSRATGIGGHRLALYCSAEAHYSVKRAAEVLGLGSTHVRAIPIDQHRRMIPSDLASAIASDRAAGVIPMAVVATAGTTLTGAVDSIGDLADAAPGIWLHVDGAYGLPAAGAPTSRHLFAGLDRADSLSIDAHKWMFVPKACSAILVKDPASLAAAFSHNEAYIPHDFGDVNAVDATLEYSRPLRALKLWLAFKVHGAEAIRFALEKNLEQARLLYALASDAPDFEVLLHKPQLSTVPLRHIPNSLVTASAKDLSNHNAALQQAVISDGRVYISPAQIDGETWLRPCFTNFRTTTEDVVITFDTIREISEKISQS